MVGGREIPSVIDYLRRFNRKERFYLVGWALGNPDFHLGDEFRRALGERLRLPIPRDCFVAMDYHLNWIWAAIFLSSTAEGGPVFKNPEMASGGERIIQGNQEDVDLLVAFKDTGMSHIVMVEAKGDSAWSNEQLRHKARRLRAIFATANAARISPHFILASPRQCQKIDVDDCPDWMACDGQIPWLDMPWGLNLERVYRCDELGRKSAGAGYWRTSGQT